MFPIARRSVLRLACAAAVAPPMLLSTPVARAHEATVGALAIRHPWARATAAGAKAGALYLTVVNSGAEADRLVGIASEVAERCAIHLSEMSGGVMTMRMVESVEIPAGGSATFAPKGAHIMLMGLRAPLRKGDRFAATLRFEKAGEVTVEVAVQGIADLQPAE